MVTNSETHMPGTLDVLLRDLHQLWCEEAPYTEPSWHLADADPIRAAQLLACGLWKLAGDADHGDPNAVAALVLLNGYIELEDGMP